MTDSIGDHEDEPGSEDEIGLSLTNKIQLLQEAKQCFMATSVKPKKLVDVLTKCIFIMLKGDKLTKAEATDLFFLITHLFQYKNKDNTLRRLTYIGIKALSQQADNVYVVASSLTTDVNSSKDDPAVRASALRALCQISDSSTFQTIESYLRQSVVDKHPVVASAALTSLMRIAQTNGEIVLKCTNEIQAALSSDSPMVQYHALALIHMLCKNDRLAISQLLSTCISQKGLKSPLAVCLLLRILANYINESLDGDDVKKYIAYIRGNFNNDSEMVQFEASKVMVEIALAYQKLNQVQFKSEELAAISRLRNFLTAAKPSLRFAAVRLLNELNSINLDTRIWSIHRIGSLCKLHLLTKRYKPCDEIIGVIDFANSSVVCVKYNCLLQCEELEQFEMKQEFSLGYKRTDFSITIPQVDYSMTPPGSELHCVLSFLFYIANQNYPKNLYEDRAGTIELGPNELETRQFSCEFPILVHI